MTDDERDAIGDLMLADVRERERARRGSDLTDEKRFAMLTRGEVPPPRKEAPTRTHETLAGSSVDVAVVPDGEPPDISEPTAEPECPVCDGDGEAPAGTYSPARASIPACSECGGTGKASPVQLHAADDFDSMAAKYGVHGPDASAPDPGYQDQIDEDLEEGLAALCDAGIYISRPHNDGICRISMRSVRAILLIQERYERLRQRLAALLEEMP